MVDRALQNLGKMKNSRRSANSKAQRLEGGGRKQAHPELGMALFRWFIDIRQGLSGRVSIKMFPAKAVELKEAAIAHKRQQGLEVSAEELSLKFTWPWIKRWMEITSYQAESWTWLVKS